MLALFLPPSGPAHRPGRRVADDQDWPPSGEAVTVRKKEIVDRRKSDVSNMPPGIVNVLQKDQVLDLVAYLISDPPPNSPAKK